MMGNDRDHHWTEEKMGWDLVQYYCLHFSCRRKKLLVQWTDPILEFSILLHYIITILYHYYWWQRWECWWCCWSKFCLRNGMDADDGHYYDYDAYYRQRCFSLYNLRFFASYVVFSLVDWLEYHISSSVQFCEEENQCVHLLLLSSSQPTPTPTTFSILLTLLSLLLLYCIRERYIVHFRLCRPAKLLHAGIYYTWILLCVPF